MVELTMAIMRSKADIVRALRMKSVLWKKGIELKSMVIRDDEGIPARILEDIMRLKIIGVLKNNIK